MSNPSILPYSYLVLTYGQIVTGQIGKQALLDSSVGIQANPTYGNGLFRATNTGNPIQDRLRDNFYTGLTFNTNSFFTNESQLLGNYYGQNSFGINTLLGYMSTVPQVNFPGSISISGFQDQDNQYHTLLFNTNALNASAVFVITYFEGNTITLTEPINVSSTPAGQNYIYNLTQSAETPGDTGYWNNILINVTNATTYTTNIVGILKTPNLLTPQNMVCFAEDSMVFTPNGEVAIQDLKQGDLVYDENYNLQKVEFIAKRTFFPSKSNKYSIPYEIKKNQLGENVPNKDTIVSASHLIKYEGKMVPASQLGTEAEINSAITYYNVSVSNYSTMIVNGMVSETLDTSNDKKVYEKIY